MIRELTLADAMHVVSRMRQRDRDGFRAVLGEVSDDHIAANRWQCYGPAWVLDVDRRPSVIAGVNFLNDWTGFMWLVAVDGLRPESWRKVIRQTRTVISNALNPSNEHGKRRIEAHVMADWPEAQELVRRLGFEFEGVRRCAGFGGEDVQVWSIVRKKQ